jgi:uncharacterized protein involved in exopolysaccharide biosynthesis
MEQTGQNYEVSSVRDILTILFKHKFKIIAIFLIVLAVATALAYTHPRFYEARGVILVKLGREYLNRPEEVAKPSTAPLIPQHTIIAGEIAIMQSRDLIERVVRQIGPEKLYPALAEAAAKKHFDLLPVAVDRFSNGLRVTDVAGSSFIQVFYFNENPVMAANAVNLLMELFKEKHLEVFAGEGTDFLESQIGVFQKKLRQSEANLGSFKQRYSVFSLEEQQSQLLGSVNTLENSLRAIQVQIGEVEQKIAFTKSPKWMADVPMETGLNPASVRQQLSLLEQKERELLHRYTENSEAVRNIREEIGIVRDSLAKNSQRVREEQRQNELAKYAGELEVLRVKAAGLKSQLSQSESELRALGSRAGELRDLQRKAADDEQNFKVYARKLEEARISDDMDRRKMVALSIVEKATPSRRPMKSKYDKASLIPGGLLGGLIAGIALAFLLEVTSSSMTTPTNAEKRLGLPVMVAIRRKSL